MAAQMCPEANSPVVSKSMRANKSSGTKPELILSKLLGKKIKKNNLPGSPDFVFPRRRVAVFVHGCFWHRCPICSLQLPKRNRAFWAEKFRTNKERDSEVSRKLENMGWSVIVVWEHELKAHPEKVKERIMGVQ